MSEPTVFSSWVYISRAADLPGVWVAHCLDFNIVSQGDSPTHALEMVQEAFSGALLDDIARGIDPNKRRGEVDAQDWQPLLRLLKNGRKIVASDMDSLARDHTLGVFATVLTVAVAVTSRPPDIDLAVQEEVRAA